MKYCLKYSNLYKYLNDADEITIKYIEDKGLVSFMEKFPNKRINLQIDTINFKTSEINILAAIRKNKPELKFVVALDKYDLNLMKELKAKDIPFYASYPCHDWELMHHLVECGVSDINISGPLAFNLPKVKQFIDKQDRPIQTRITANIVASEYDFTPKIVSFFIRPEDIEMYSEYIDICDFEDVSKQNYFYNIYANLKLFYGNLNQIIFNYPDPIDNKCILPQFAERRISCDRECLKGGRCRRCYTMANLAKNMHVEVTEQIKENILKQIKEKEKSNEN